mgnify:CR=1 FL=1
MLVVPLVDQQGVLGSLVVLRKTRRRIFAEPDRADEDLCAPVGAGDAQCAAVHRSGPARAASWRSAHSTVREQADKLQEQTEQLKDWNRSLEERVETQLGEIERIRKLERFLAPQVAQLIASSDGHDALLDSHRREVTVVFCDLRGFTAFTETTEPEEAMNVLREYHAALGELIFRYEGTLDRYAGDGVMILFNAPIQFADHTERAVKMAVEMRDTIGELTEQLAQPRPQSRLRHRHRARLRHARPDRLRAAARNTPRSAASPTSPRGCATKPRPARSWCPARLRHGRALRRGQRRSTI